MKRLLFLFVALLLLPVAAADTLFEDFEFYTIDGFLTDVKPGLNWYSYSEGIEGGNVTDDAPVISGSQSFRMNIGSNVDPNNKYSRFTLGQPAEVSSIEIFVDGVTIGDDGIGSEQYFVLQSSAPVRTLVEFYLFCHDSDNPTGCELRVRWQQSDSTGQTLIATSAGQSEFQIEVVPDWFNSEFQLFVDTVDDGAFPFLELPTDFARIQFKQYRGTVPINLAFDDWTIEGGFNVTASGSEGDITEGLKNFATNIRFTTSASLFALGLVVFIILVAAVIVPSLALGFDNTIIPAVSFFAALSVLWLVMMEWWPDWVGIALIVIVAALVSFMIRRLLMGIKDASTNAGIVAGALGYFIIASSLLAFSGYAADSIKLPSGGISIEEDTNVTSEKQPLLEAGLECVWTGFKSTFSSVKADCSQYSESEEWGKVTDFLSTVFNFARTAFQFLFQLLTFQLPIPTIFNVMIVLPPAAALATVGYSFITRTGS